MLELYAFYFTHSLAHIIEVSTTIEQLDSQSNCLIEQLRILLRARCNEYVINGFTHDEITELRTGARPAIRTPRIHHVFADSTVLYKLIKLLNSLYLHEPNIMSAIQNGTHLYTGICFYAKQIFLKQYTYTCNILNCYICKHAQ